MKKEEIKYPDTIYLQHDPEEEFDIEVYNYSDARNITWCADKINSNDISYTRNTALKNYLQQLKTHEEVSQHEDKTGYVRALNDVLNLIRII